MMHPIAYIIDDDEMARTSLAFLLTTHGIQTQKFGSGAEFFERTPFPFGCILLDLRMPEMDGLEFQQELKNRGHDLPVIMVSAEGDIPSAVRAIKSGALDFLDKGGCEADVISAIRGALSNLQDSIEGARARQQATTALNRLSPREFQVLEGILGGLKNKEMANRLDLSHRTIEMHRAKLLMKLGVSSITEIVRLASDAGMEFAKTSYPREDD